MHRLFTLPPPRALSLTVLLCLALTGGPMECWRSCKADSPQVFVLGIAQDAGYPQAGCRKTCCAAAWEDVSKRRLVSCVAVVDPDSGERWMLDCTPDFREQLRLLDQAAPRQPGQPLLHGVLPTHAHMGHYTGLMHLGREAMGASSIPVFAMPRMKYFLESNGPWSQLIELNQIEIRRLAENQALKLNARLNVTPIPVPHRDEYSETVGFEIQGPKRRLLYLPDIDKWDRWECPVEDAIRRVDFALLDGTFFDGQELPGRDMTEIPHPFIQESLERFRTLPPKERAKIHFIHLNHTNPLLDPTEPTQRTVKQAGCFVATQWTPKSQLGQFEL